MKEETYGWNLEMLMRVAAARLPALEIAVGQRRRIGGVSKVSGNLIARRQGGLVHFDDVCSPRARAASELLADNSCQER